ncbi:MAG: hypothetical protein K2Q22_03815 [Cytophagales bacterium]|nr:hypothetical protein [Cytophagales bacterium]
MYREGGFGMYDGVTGDVDTTTVKLPLEQAFKNYFGKVTQSPQEGNSLNSWTPNVYPNPFQTVFQIDNTEASETTV